MMHLSKSILGRVVRLLGAYGVTHVIISPGSRNAPLITAFAACGGLELLSVPDERSAAYFGIGLSQQTGKPTVLVCTSGTASLNYAPAVAEAYYQKIPLLVFTADRPADRIDQGDGQAIRQHDIYRNFSKKSYLFPEEIADEKETEKALQIIHDAVALTLLPEPGPVHINFPFSEPLYGFTPDTLSKVFPQPLRRVTGHLPQEKRHFFTRQWGQVKKKMIITGQMLPGHGLEPLLEQINRDPSVVLLTETTSNILTGETVVAGIDKVVETIRPGEEELFAPGLVVTLGGHLVSRKVKAFLRKVKPSEHWHVSVSGKGMDMFSCLTHTIHAAPKEFLRIIAEGSQVRQSDYKNVWIRRMNRSEQRMAAYLEHIPFCDLRVFQFLLESLPERCQVHLGNSTPVRYHQLFCQEKNHYSKVYGNRGVSGIDGAVSTAAGASWIAEDPVYLIVGDMGFLYDSNGLWHQYAGSQLKIIVINNGGGGIFRYIEGPVESGYLPYFEVPHTLSVVPIAQMHGLAYRQASDEQGLVNQLQWLHTTPGPLLLEVRTPRETNGKVLKEFFNTLKR